MKFLSLFKNAFKKTLIDKLNYNEKEVESSISKIIGSIHEQKDSSNNQEVEIFNELGNLCDVFQYFFEYSLIKYTDGILYLSNDSNFYKLKDSYNKLCYYENNYKKYNKEILRLLDISKIGNRTNLGQFLLHPSRNYVSFEKKVVELYIKGLKYWKKESKYMSQNEEIRLNSNIKKILEFYPFIKNYKDAMTVSIPKCESY